MRVSSRVVLIACSASVIGAPNAAACSPQDYMSPEEWQALSPEQRAENTVHDTHEAVPTAPATPVARPTDPPATAVDRPATGDGPSQGSQPSGNQDAGAGSVEAPPVREAAPVVPALDGPSHSKPTAKDPATTGARSTPRAATSPTGPESTREAPAGGESAASVAAGGRTVVAVEQLTRMTAGSRGIDSGAAQRARRRADERAAQRRASAQDRRRSAGRAADRRPEAQVSGRTPVRADEAPITATTDANGRVTALAAVLAALAALAALLVRMLRPEAPAAATSTRIHPRPDTDDGAAVDPIEAELQAIIAAQAATRTAQAPRAQEAGTGDESSTATNSA